MTTENGGKRRLQVISAKFDRSPFRYIWRMAGGVMKAGAIVALLDLFGRIALVDPKAVVVC
ncbi:hypothetical protein [Phyllobacterium myrsinacearum]|uniref:Uncharacterized protein n=1 Tax=Phyllobacterium myrsinacearum TaxID=28101 RepID=A0A839EJD5_9HYPH|nr:hypothetical protein [Phyllobacterium myrsinacearum]MBA8876617.1 hypothetical protein [Phyllobacterium myrsinacearum]